MKIQFSIGRMNGMGSISSLNQRYFWAAPEYVWFGNRTQIKQQIFMFNYEFGFDFN